MQFTLHWLIQSGYRLTIKMFLFRQDIPKGQGIQKYGNDIV